jgi:Uma2 family endonuclease
MASSPPGREQWCPDPVLIVEVLSPPTEADNRGVKLRAYRRLPSVQRILLLATDRPAVEHYAREGERWVVEDLGPDDLIRLAAFDVALPVGELYDGLPLEEAEGLTP